MMEPEKLDNDRDKGDSEHYLTRAEFYQYMGRFTTKLENRLTLMESRLENKLNGGNGKKSGAGFSLLGGDCIKEKIILILIGALLSLAGAAAGIQFLSELI